MHRFTLILALAFVVVPTALAGGAAAGDGALSVLNANGAVTVVGRGTIYGQLDRGTLTVTDPDPTDGLVQVVGADHTTHPFPHVTVYFGKDITFRLVGGRYKLAITDGVNIDFLAVGVGKAWLRGDPTAVSTGTYTVDGAKNQVLPVAPTVPPAAGTTWPGVAVPFGVQPATS